MIHALFTPSADDYAASSTTKSVTVTQASTSVSYSGLSSIVYQTTLGASLIATVSPSVSGTFNYYLDSSRTNEVLSTTVLNAGSYTIYAFFTSSNANYTSSSKNTGLNVNKFTPVLEYIVTSSIVYGTEIASLLTAMVTTDISGTMSYYLDTEHTDALLSTDVLNAGSPTIYALFTPDSVSNFNSASIDEQVTIDKQSTAITFPATPSIVYETTLDAFISGTTSGGIAGTFAFTANSDAVTTSTVLPVGTYTVSCTFTPTDANNYLSSTNTKTLSVNINSTHLTFASAIPTSIVYGTTLTQVLSTVLTPDVDGSIKFYTDSEHTSEVQTSTVLHVASYTIYAVFVPTSANYTSSSASTSLSVTKATTSVTYPTLTNIVYGTAMSSRFTAFVTPSITGAFSYYYMDGETKVSISTTDTLHVGSYTVNVDFTPNSSNYSASSSQQSLIVTAAPSFVIYNTLSNIAYSTTLASSLTAVVFPNIAGVMKYYIDSSEVSSITVLNAGAYSITATFTPTSSNYGSSTTAKSLIVEKKSTTIAFPATSTIIYETTLATLIAETSAGVAGTYSFYQSDLNGAQLSSSTVLDAGSYTIFCKFIPTDSTNYLSSEATKSLSVTARSTTLSYSVSIPSSIVYNTTLASILVTTSTPNVAGTTTYAIDGTAVTSASVLDVGTYTILATFIPTEDEYSQSSVSTTIYVTPASSTLSFTIPSSIVYGTTLNSSLTATCDRVGTISYFYDSARSQVAETNDTPNVGVYTIYALFTPTSSNDLSSNATASLTVTKHPTSVTLAPATITYETPLAIVLNASVSPSIPGMFNYYYLLGSTQVVLTSVTILNVGLYAIYADFTPTDSINYSSSSSSSANLLVSQQTITVTYSGLSAITYGQTLSSSLTATLTPTVAGNLNYYLDSEKTTEATSTTVLNAGTSTLYAVFTPASSNYVSYQAMTQIVVNRAAPTVLFGALPAITYGTLLQSSFTASVSPSIAGSISYYLFSDLLSSTQILNTGSYNIRAQFTSSNPNYTSASATSSLQVLKQVPAVTLSSTTTIIYGATLASFITGTTADVAGTFNFYLGDSTPLTSSTVLNAGSYTIYYTFSPSDSANYSVRMASTTFVVTKQIPYITMSSINSIAYGTTMSSYIHETDVSTAGTLTFFVNDALGEQLTPTTVLNAGEYTIYCSFAPTDPLIFQSATATKILTVEKMSTTVAMSSISTFAYGTTMSQFISETTTSVIGTKTFYVTDTYGLLLTSSSVLNVGTYTIYCMFDPTDGANYLASFATKQLTVSQTQLVVSYGPLSPLTYGTTITDRLTASTSPVADGSMNYFINSVNVTNSTILDASSHVITATFTPGSSNYIGASATSTLVVNKASTIVTYPVLPSVLFNTPIGTASLSATVSPDISGIMDYFTDSAFANQVFSSTTFTVGVYTVYARFTPTSPNYTVSSATSSITVVGLTAPTITFPNVTIVAAYTTLDAFINATTTGVAGTYVFRKNNSTGDILTTTTTLSFLGNFVIFCSFTPTNTELYVPSSASYTITVKFTPTFLFTQRPSSTVTYGTNLAGSVLTTTLSQFNNANIPGTITFSNNITAASILLPGIYTVVATFTPTNLSLYNATTTSKVILVNKQDISVMITTPSVKAAFIKSTPIQCTYQVIGILSALGDTFQNSVTGTIVDKYMSYDESEVLTFQHVYNSTFSGASQNYKIAADISGFVSTKYSFTQQSYIFTINKYTPTITYAVSSPNKSLVYGTALGANQLNAAVSYNGTQVTTGSVIYTRSTINLTLTVDSQTQLDVGQYNLYAYYSDPVGNIYNSVNTSTVTTNQITIAKATPVIVFPNIKSILVDTNLNSILGATAAHYNANIIDGTFVFSYVNENGATVIVNSLTVLTQPPSSFTINGLFTPTDTTRYNSCVESISITLSDTASTLTAVALLQSQVTYGKTIIDMYTISVSPSIAGTYSYYYDLGAIEPDSIMDVGTYTYTVFFNPTSLSYAASSINVTFTVQNANMQLSYLTPPSYSYQTANQLSLLQPAKSVAVDGEFKIFLDSAFTNELTNATPIAVGSYTLYARFTPVKNYNVATTTTTLTVTKIPTSLTKVTQTSSITYGATTASFLNNSVVNSIAGNIQYYYDISYTQIVNSTDVLDFGTRTIYYRFVPTNSNYAMSYATHTVTVSKTTLLIEYPTLSSIQYGATLQSCLTASATFAGSINYFINGIEVFANTELNVGSYTITAIFTPTNPSNFTTSSASITQTLTVTKLATSIIYAPANIISGTTFGPSMTASAVTNIPGTMQYFINGIEVVSSTVLGDGNHTMQVIFTPTNMTNYNSSTTSVPITVMTSQQFGVFTQNIQQIQNASNNQIVTIIGQNLLLPSTLDVKVNILSAGQTTFTRDANVQFNFLDQSMNSSVKAAVSTFTVDLPNAANSNSIYFKFYDQIGTSVINDNNRVSLFWILPQFKGITQYLYLLRMLDIGADFDGTRNPLIPVDFTDPENITFTAIFRSNSTYVAVYLPPPSLETPLVSNNYAFNATGGYFMQRGFDDIKQRELFEIETFDVTDSVQVLLDVALFNAKLGLSKNADNNQIVSSQFNVVTDQFEIDGSPVETITFSASEFISSMVKKEQIISVGKYSTVYSDFQSYVATYFGYDGGFSSLFTAASEFAIDIDNHFDNESMLKLFTGTGSAYVNEMTGSISISNITSSLRYCIDTNCFGNRTPMADLSQNATGSAIDPVDKNNYGVEDGFVAGDLIWIPTGTTLNLNLNIDVDSFMPVNNVGLENTSLSQNTNYDSGDFSQETTATTTNINRTVRAPLLIKLVNGSTISSL